MNNDTIKRNYKFQKDMKEFKYFEKFFYDYLAAKGFNPELVEDKERQLQGIDVINNGYNFDVKHCVEKTRALEYDVFEDWHTTIAGARDCNPKLAWGFDKSKNSTDYYVEYMVINSEDAYSNTRWEQSDFPEDKPEGIFIEQFIFKRTDMQDFYRKHVLSTIEWKDDNGKKSLKEIYQDIFDKYRQVRRNGMRLFTHDSTFEYEDYEHKDENPYGHWTMFYLPNAALLSHEIEIHHEMFFLPITDRTQLINYSYNDFIKY